MKKKCMLNTLSILLFLGALTACSKGNDVQGTTQQETTQTREHETAGEEAVEEPEKHELQKTQLSDMSEAFDTILNHATKEFIAGYLVDDSFLMWFDAKYGDFAVQMIADEVLTENPDTEVWYDASGESLHVLWMDYCKDMNIEQEDSNPVYYKESNRADETVLSFIGDINFADGWYTTEYMEQQENGVEDCISSELLQLMNDADIMTVNNEFTYGEKGTALPGKAYTFQAATSMVQNLELFGTDLVNLANNQVYDYGKEGLRKTMDAINAIGIPYVGAGENLDEAEKIVYFVVNGRKIAIVSATEIERTTNFTKEATETSPGVLKMLNPNRFMQVIEKADQTSDYVIALTHWGTEGKILYDNLEMMYAQKLVAAGADAIIGGHPHRLQGCGFINGAPVAYSLGNFWFSTGSLYTTVAQIVIEADGTLRLQYVPCLQENLTTHLITNQEEREDFFDYLATISYDVGIDENGFVYDKQDEDYEKQDILYDSDICNAEVTGLFDNDDNAIDIVGNLKQRTKMAGISIETGIIMPMDAVIPKYTAHNEKKRGKNHEQKTNRINDFRWIWSE